MTRGYYVKEQGGKVINAVYLSSDAYLQNGYGERIIEAFMLGKEEQMMDSIAASMDSADKKNMLYVKPEWYRKTVNSKIDAFYEEYGYVLRNPKEPKLVVYHHGKRLFALSRKEAPRWLYFVQNLSKLIDGWIYSQEKLNYEWENYGAMFHFIEEKIKLGMDEKELHYYMRENREPLSFFSDSHLMDAWYRPEKPAYQKVWKKGMNTVEFIVSKEWNKWQVYVQLPFCRSRIMQEYTSEKQACRALLQLIKEQEPWLINFAKISTYFTEISEKIREGKTELKEVEIYLKEQEKSNPWFLENDNFSVVSIMSETR
mgnify:CR=1 FL=1